MESKVNAELRQAKVSNWKVLVVNGVGDRESKVKRNKPKTPAP